MIVDVQVNPGRLAWPEVRDLALAAETAGYGAVWTFDHLAGSSLARGSMLETFTLLGALAVATSTIELGTMVANVHNRTPATLAVAAASVEAIADRTVHLGLGAGSSRDSRWSAEMPPSASPSSTPWPVATPGSPRSSTWSGACTRRTVPPRSTRSPARGADPRRHRRQRSDARGGRRPAADGVNVGWEHPRRDELFAAAVAARGGRRGFELSTWLTWSAGLLDPEHAVRQAMARAGVDRAVLVVPAGVRPDDVSGRRPH